MVLTIVSATGGVVTVSLNHRLNILGTLDLSAVPSVTAPVYVSLPEPPPAAEALEVVEPIETVTEIEYDDVVLLRRAEKLPTLAVRRAIDREPCALEVSIERRAYDLVVFDQQQTHPRSIVGRFVARS